MSLQQLQRCDRNLEDLEERIVAEHNSHLPVLRHGAASCRLVELRDQQVQHFQPQQIVPLHEHKTPQLYT